MHPQPGPESLFGIGFLLFAAALIVYGLILHKLLKMVRPNSKIWILPIIAAAFLILSVCFHFYGVIFFIPKVAHSSGPTDPTNTQYLFVRTIEFVIMMIGGIFSAITGLIYYIWTSK